MTYKIYDTKLGLFTRPTYKTRRAALHAADKLDNAYGAYRYYVTEEKVAMVMVTSTNVKLVA